MSQHNTDLAEWVETYSTELYSWAYFKLSDTEMAKDIVQDTFMAAAEKIDGFKGDSTPKTWLFSILNFKIIDVYRKRAKMSNTGTQAKAGHFFDKDGSWVEAKKPLPWPDEDSNLLDDTDFQITLKKCLDALPEKWSACVKFKYLLDKSGDDICQELEITPTNFWQIMHRAKLNLRDCIDKNWFQMG